MPARIIVFVAPINIFLSYLLGESLLNGGRIMDLDGVFQFGVLIRFALGLLERRLRLLSHII